MGAVIPGEFARWVALAAEVDAALEHLRGRAVAYGADPGAAVARAVELHRTTGVDQLGAIDLVRGELADAWVRGLSWLDRQRHNLDRGEL